MDIQDIEGKYLENKFFFTHCYFGIVEKTKEELHERHMTHVTEITESHQQQLEAARLELERAVEISHQRVSPGKSHTVVYTQMSH